MTDSDLLAVFVQISAGDQDAWTQLVVELAYQVRGWAVRAGVPACDLDDIAQATWLKLWLAMRHGIRFATGAELCGYLKRATERTAIDAWRAAKRRPAYADDEILFERGYVPMTFPLDGLTRRQQRLAALLWGGYSIAEIAAAWGITANAVYRQRARLRRDW